MTDAADQVDVLIIGAGQAGAGAAISLRQGGFEGSIAMVGDEPLPPYDRPPLSKDYLAGEKSADRLLLRPLEFWAARNVALILGQRAVGLEAKARVITLANGERLGYRQLIWAAGGAPRTLPLPGADSAGIHVIRTREQVDRLRADAAQARRVVIIGGGYIGLEAAAVLVSQGKQVTLLEAENRVLARVAAEPLSRFYESEHRRRGVVIQTGARLASIGCTDGRATHVRLASGEELPADLIIVGIGLAPHQAVLEGAGAACGNGVIVDAFCQTSLPGVFAIDDCACHPNPYAGGAQVRLESVPNAVEQAKTVASVILGQPAPYRALPWFWSNQYDLKLQTAGLNLGFDQTVLRGEPETRSFSLVYLRRGQVIAIDAVNAIKDFMQAKALIEAAVRVDPARLADNGTPLKALMP